MPKLGMTMTEGTLAEWLVPDGAEVVAGQPVFRLTTEKVDTEADAPGGGTVRQVVGAGTVVAVGSGRRLDPGRRARSRQPGRSGPRPAARRPPRWGRRGPAPVVGRGPAAAGARRRPAGRASRVVGSTPHLWPGAWPRPRAST